MKTLKFIDALKLRVFGNGGAAIAVFNTIPSWQAVVLAFTYVGGFLVLVGGLHAFTKSLFDVDMLTPAIATLVGVVKFLWKQVGWSLPLFVVMAIPLGRLSWVRWAARQELTAKQHAWLSHLETNAYYVGIFGTIVHLLMSGQKGSHALQGLGSLALGLTFWIWCVWIGFNPDKPERKESAP